MPTILRETYPTAKKEHRCEFCCEKIFQSKGFFGSGIRYADDGCFNLAEMHKFLQETYKKRCVITFWKEITCEEYEKMSDYLEDGRGR